MMNVKGWLVSFYAFLHIGEEIDDHESKHQTSMVDGRHLLACIR